MRVGLFLSDFPIYYLPWACEIVDGLAARGLEIDLYLQNAGEKVPALQNNINMINFLILILLLFTIFCYH